MIVENFPYFWFKTFPKFRPRSVKRKLVIENINDDNMYLFVMAEKPIPTVKLSILTDKPNNRNPGILIKNDRSFSLKLDIIISIAIKVKIIPSRMSCLNIILLVKNEPMLSPISGIIK